eukprot:3940744-Pyramimonas_sp.AAC.1
MWKPCVGRIGWRVEFSSGRVAQLQRALTSVSSPSGDVTLSGTFHPSSGLRRVQRRDVLSPLMRLVPST